MIYPDKFEDKIGFTTIRRMLADRCRGPAGKEIANGQLLMFEAEGVRTAHQQGDEYLEIIRTGNDHMIFEYDDISYELHRVRLKGTYLEPDHLLAVKMILEMTDLIISTFRKGEFQKYTGIGILAESMVPCDHLTEKIDRIVDERAQVKDRASDDLYRLRTLVRKKIRENESVINSILEQSKKQGWTSSDAEISVREGRLLIPVAASSKRKLTGFIHDESATGQTVYIEPTQNFHLNNEIRELENEIRREIIRILVRFTEVLRPEIDSILHNYAVLGQLDFIRAKALLAETMGSVKPNLSGKPQIDWKDAFHPLLLLKNREQNKPTIPLDIRLDRDKRILIISGPNAGGKSVCLKSIGLLQYMLQCGLLVPMKAESTAGIFHQLFIEIGDEQSIDQDLSTYSSHLTHIRELMSMANESTLFLIDEFGAGTDPQLGGALAEAIIEHLASLGPFGVVTTHYSNLKLLADSIPHVVNGAMLYDTTEMKPLFRLRTGKPGSSFAFEIAKNIGLPSELIEDAARKTGATHLDFERQLQELEKEKEEVISERSKFQMADTMLDELIRKYESMVSNLELQRKEILNKAYKDAEEIIRRSNRLIENTVREIRESQAERERTKMARLRLGEEKERLDQKKSAIDEKQPPIAKKEQSEDIAAPIRKGDWVIIKDQGAVGQVREVKRNNVLIDLNGINFRTSLSKIERTKTPPKQKARPRTRVTGTDLNEKVTNFQIKIDLRGKKAEEAIGILERYIDDAILLSIKEVTILHGKGDGILRRITREYLNTIAEVDQVSDAHIERGGAGITLVTFK